MLMLMYSDSELPETNDRASVSNLRVFAYRCGAEVPWATPRSTRSRYDKRNNTCPKDCSNLSIVIVAHDLGWSYDASAQILKPSAAGSASVLPASAQGAFLLGMQLLDDKLKSLYRPVFVTQVQYYGGQYG